MNDNVEKLLRSKNPLLWIDSKEYERCVDMLKGISSNLNKSLYVWDVSSKISQNGYLESEEDPIEFLKDKQDSILLLLDYHKYIEELENWRELVNSISDNTKNDNSIIIISPIVKIPEEISHYITLCDFPLPNKEDFVNTVQSLAKEYNIELSEKEIQDIAINGLGLTMYEFKNAIYLSLVDKKIDKNIVYEAKKQLVEKNGNIKIYDSECGFDTLCGMDNMKDFTKKMVLSGNGKGILIVGIPGGGKTEFAKRLGHETGRITIAIDFGELMGAYVGETEQNTKQALKVIDTISPCIVFIDEIEKGLSGTTNGDSVSQRQGGQFLKWMQDHESDAYVVATANNIEKLPSEYLRSGRWDAIFFVDMPTNKTKREILNVYKNKYSIKDDIKIENENYAGAEIETLCRLSSNMNISLEEAKKYVCPIYNTMGKRISDLRSWASNRTVPAEIHENDEIKRRLI